MMRHGARVRETRAPRRTKPRRLIVKIKGVTEDQIKACAVRLGMHFNVTGHVGNYVQGVLRMTGPWKGKKDEPRPYWKHGWTRFAWGRGPRYAHGAVCFHGHRDFMREIYKINPQAVIRTKLAAYVGSEGFERVFPPLADRNIGSEAMPLRYGAACDCEPKFRTIRASDLSRCPFTIFVASHYRSDGTCKCDDPQEREKMIREWGYTKASFKNIPLRGNV